MADDPLVLLTKQEKQFCSDRWVVMLGYPTCTEIVSARKEPLNTLQTLKPEDHQFEDRFLIAALQLSKIRTNRQENLKSLIAAVERNPVLLDKVTSLFLPDRGFIFKGIISEDSKQFFLAGSYYWLEMARKQNEPKITYDIANAALEFFPEQILKLLKVTDLNYEALLLKATKEVAKEFAYGSFDAKLRTHTELLQKFDEKPHLIQQIVPELLKNPQLKVWLISEANSWMFLSLKHGQTEAYESIIKQWANPDPRIKIEKANEADSDQRKWNNNDRVRELEKTLSRYDQKQDKSTPFIAVDSSKSGFERIVKDLAIAYAETAADLPNFGLNSAQLEKDFQRNRDIIFNAIRKNPEILPEVVQSLRHEKGALGYFKIFGMMMSGVTELTFDELKERYHQSWFNKDPIAWFQLAREVKNDSLASELGIQAARINPWDMLPQLQPNDPGRRESVVAGIRRLTESSELLERDFNRNNALAALAILGNPAQSKSIISDIASDADTRRWLGNHTSSLIKALPNRPDLHKILLENLVTVASSFETSAPVFMLAARNVEGFKNSRTLTYALKDTFSIQAKSRKDAIEGMRHLAPLSKILQDNRLLHHRTYPLGEFYFYTPTNPSLLEQVQTYTKGHTQSLLKIDWRGIANAVPKEDGIKLFDFVTNTILSTQGLANHTTTRAYQDNFISKVRKELAAIYSLPETLREDASTAEISRRNSLLNLKNIIEGSKIDSIHMLVEQERRAVQATRKKARN